MMNALEQCYESQFATRTWYFKQLTILDLKYSHYIEKILQYKASIKSKLEQEYKHRLQNIDKNIKVLTNNNQSDECDIESIKQEVKHFSLIDIDENKLLDEHNIHSLDIDVKLYDNDHEQYNISHKQSGLTIVNTESNRCIGSDNPNANGLASLETGNLTKICDDLENEQRIIANQGKAVTESKPKPKPQTLISKIQHKNQSKLKHKSDGGKNKSLKKCWKKLIKNDKALYKCNVCSKVYSRGASTRNHYISKHTTRF